MNGPNSRYFQAHGIKCGQRLEEYVRLAESGLWTALEQRLDENTQNAAEHPNAIILAAITVMTAQAKARGYSNVPAVKGYVEHLQGQTTEARLAELGLRLPKIIA